MLRYLDRSQFRFLTAVEMGMKNHEIVPLALVVAIGQLKDAVGMSRALSKEGLICFESVKKKNYDGVRLTNKGYDYLSLKTLTARGSIASFGNQIGTGKESNVYVVGDAEGEEVLCLKLHRLGRTCFRKIREKRDYHKKRKQMSWIYLSRISATKEFAYMKALYDRGFPVPKPIDFNRHCVVMELVQGHPLQNVSEVTDAAALYDKLMNLILKFANHGVIHGDFNEFNIMVTDAGEPIIIDFPQMVSTEHRDARYYFDRDVNCVREFFRRRFGYESELHPSFDDVEREDALDAEISASGITRQMEKDILKGLGIGSDDEEEDEEEDENENEEESEGGESAETEGAERDVAEEMEPAKEMETKEEDLDSLRREFEVAVNIRSFGKVDEADAQVPSDDCDDDVSDLPQFNNREFKPFRDPRLSNEDETRSMMSSCSTVIDPDDVKRRVKASLARRQHATDKRRISKKGVACVVNRKRREDKEDIKTSTSAFWAD